MPQATLEERVELLDSARTGKGLLTRALPLPTGWERGIIFRGANCVTPQLAGTCIIDDPEPPERVSDAVTFRPLYIRQSATCSTLSRVGPMDRANERLIGTTEWGLGRVLAEGFPGEPNPSFADATQVMHGSALLPSDAATEALACLEQAIADTGYGSRAFLHSSYKAATYLTKAGLIDGDGRSPAGNQWIISAGYPGGTTVATIWATGPVWAAVGAVQNIGALNARFNDDEAWSQRLAMAAFDPCINFAATFNVPACTGGS